MTKEGDNGGPIFDFLAKSGIYQDFAKDFLDSHTTPLSNENQLPIREKNGVYALELQVATASFELHIDTKMNQGTATLQFPSRRIADPRSMHLFMDGLLHAAYPRERYPNINYSPKVGFIIGDRALDYDLRTYWDGSFYEGTLSNPDISEVVYGFDVSPFINMPALPKAVGMDTPRGFFYGFRLSDDPHEFVRMSHHKASVIDAALVREFLPHNKDYQGQGLQSEADRDAQLKADSEELTGKVRQACKEYPEQRIFG